MTTNVTMDNVTLIRFFDDSINFLLISFVKKNAIAQLGKINKSITINAAPPLLKLMHPNPLRKIPAAI